MEALAEAAAESLLDLTPNYDASRHSFHSSVDGSSHGATSSVRHVNNKPLPAQHPVGVIGGGTHGLDPTGRDKGRPTELFDIFTGLIDGISGELLHGTREYVLTGETYEGPFVNGLRQGDGAIARNVFLPYKTIGSTSSPNSMSTSSSSSSGKGARFFGTYENDSPRHGTLVVPSLYTYQGPIRNTRPHGNEGTLIKPSGYKYEGSFKRGLYDGTGVETEAPHAGGGVYKGSFQTGQRHGFGEYTISEDDGCGNTIVKYSYKGQWVGNKKQGEGEERICGQEIYRGQFHANERHGSGSLTFESVHRGACQSIEEGDECSCDEHDLVEEGEESPKLPIHGTPTVADGTWRAGQPLDGTHGWTLMFKNGDVYIGYASDFIPSGYGVMRYANKDIYTGQWKDGKRSGEGSFISGNGREEYVGTWKDDKIVPLNEGIKSEEMATFTDMALAVLKHEDDQTLGLDLSSHLSQIADDSSSYQQQREILESIVQRSISNSIERMQDQSITEEQTWSLTPGKARRRKSRRRSWRVELPNQRKMNTLGEKVSSLVDMAKVTSLVDIASQDASVVSDLSVSSDDFSRNTRLKTYKNGDTYYGLLSRNGRRQGYGGELFDDLNSFWTR